MKKIAIIILSLLLFISPILIYKEQVDAFAQKIITTTVKKAGKKMMFMYIDKRSVELHKEMMKRQAIDNLKEGAIKKQGYKTVRFNGRRPLNKDGNLYNIKEKITSIEEKKMQKSINEQIERRITGGRKWTIYEDVLDWIVDYKLLYSLPTVIPVFLRGDTAEELENIAIEAMFDAGVLEPANFSPNETNYADLDFYSHDGTPYNLSNIEIIANDDDDIFFEVPSPKTVTEEYFLNWTQSTPVFKEQLYTISNINLPDPNQIESSVYFEIALTDFDEYEYFTYLGISYNFDMMPELVRPLSYPEYDRGKLYKNGTEVDYSDFDYEPLYDWGYAGRFNDTEHFNPKDLDKIEFYIDKTNYMHVKYYLNDDIFEYIYKLNDEIYEQGSGERWNINNINSIDGLEILTVVDNEHEPNYNIRRVDLRDMESSRKRKAKTHDIEIEAPAKMELYSPSTFEFVNQDGRPIKFKENENGEPEIIFKDDNTPVPEDTEIEIKNPIEYPVPDPDTPPFTQSPLPDTDPVPPKYPDPNYQTDPPFQNPPGGGGTPDAPPFTGEKCGEIELDLKSIELFTTKFPFSLPFDIFRAIEAVFGQMGDQTPNFKYELMGNEIDIKIPEFIISAKPFIRSILLIIFDIGVIYGLHRLFGGAS